MKNISIDRLLGGWVCNIVSLFSLLAMNINLLVSITVHKGTPPVLRSNYIEQVQ